MLLAGIILVCLSILDIYTPVTLLILSSGTGYKTKTFRVNFKSQENIASLCLIKKVL